jgi:Tol biopolymer transport system component
MAGKPVIRLSAGPENPRPGRASTRAVTAGFRGVSLVIVAAALLLVSCTSGRGGTTAAPTTSPNADRIAFDRMNGATNYEGSYLGTVIANADGTGQQNLPIPQGWSGPVSPVWSPDGSKLLLTVLEGGMPPLRAAVIDPDGSGFRVLAPGKSDTPLACSAWSPNGSRVLCSVDRYGLEGIVSIGVDGTGLTRLTRSPFHDTVGSSGECGGGDSEADYSPDGTQFVFMRKRCGTGPEPFRDEASALYVANTDGTGLRQITKYGEADSHPGGSVRWSPDGTEILFTSQDHHLRLIHPDGSAMTGITLPPGNAKGPAWSPDGRWIVFSLARPESAGVAQVGVAHIYRARPDGTHLTEVSNTPNSDFLASWGRPPGA